MHKCTTFKNHSHFSISRYISYTDSCLTWSRSTIGNCCGCCNMGHIRITYTYARCGYLCAYTQPFEIDSLYKSISQYDVEKCLELVKGSRGWKWIVLVCFLDFYSTICKYLSNFYDWNIFSFSNNSSYSCYLLSQKKSERNENRWLYFDGNHYVTMVFGDKTSTIWPSSPPSPSLNQKLVDLMW